MRKFEVNKSDKLDLHYSSITIIEEHDGMGCDCIADVWTGETDARLLAAAPELLEQLSSVLKMMETANPLIFEKHYIDQVKDIIRKAQ
jgi:hypothetical protein